MTADTATSGPVVEMRGISKTYRANPPVLALRECDLRIGRGDYVAIMGASGSGKSTLMNIIGCLDLPTHGAYRLDGIDVRRLTDQQQSRVRNRKIGFIFQSFNLLPVLTAEENILLPLSIAGRKPDRAWYEQLVETVGLGDRLRHRPSELSGGQQQRVAVARALVSRLLNEQGIECVESPLTPADAWTADELFLTGTGAEIVPVGLAYGGANASFLDEPFVDHLKRVASTARTRVAVVIGEPMAHAVTDVQATREEARARVQGLVNEARRVVG